MKVLYLITKSNWGGAQKYVFDLATHLPEGYEIVVGAMEKGLLADKLGHAGIKFVSVSYLGIFGLIREEKPGVIHTNSSVFGGLGAFFGWLLRKKVIFTTHGWPFNENRNIFWKIIVYKLSWLTSLFSDITITITQKDFSQGKKMPFVNYKMRLIHNAIEQINFYSRDEAREKLNLGPSDLIIGSISELTKNKGLMYLAKTAEIITEAKFVVIGEGSEHQSLSATKLNLVGFVAEANRYLKAFDIFVLPSLKEGLPYVLLEAGQAGLPVVASNVGGIPDIIGDGHSTGSGQAGMLVPAKNPELLARSINALITNPELRKQLGTQLSDRVTKFFSFDNFLSETYKLYS